MKTISASLLALGLSFSSLFAQGDTSIEDSEKTEAQKNAERLLQAAKELDKAFLNIPEQQRVDYLRKRNRASTLFSNKRIFEMLPLLFELKEIFDRDPQVYNLEGAVFVELRDFHNAKIAFTKALELIGDDPKILFNIAELHFCANNWSECLKRFEQLVNKMPSSQGELGNLVELKMLLCHLALSKSEEATEEERANHLTQAKDLALRYSYLEDSPYYYYAKSALSHHEGNSKEASKWIRTARQIFGTQPQRLIPWNDTLMEYGFIPSPYGKHFSSGGDADLINLSK